MESVTSFMSYSLLCKNIEELATEIASQFDMETCSVENELMHFISDIHTSSSNIIW